MDDGEQLRQLEQSVEEKWRKKLEEEMEKAQREFAAREEEITAKAAQQQAEAAASTDKNTKELIEQVRVFASYNYYAGIQTSVTAHMYRICYLDTAAPYSAS